MLRGVNRRRLDVHEQLRTAWQMLDGMGMEAFAERGRRELLTAQEAQIARLARDGLSNPEIGARMFLSARS